MFSEFSLKCLYSTMCAKNCQIYGVHILGKCIESRRFYSCSVSIETRPQVLVITSYRQRELLISRGSVLSKICFPHKQKGVEKITICFTKIQSEKIKMTSNIRIFIFCTICNSFKCDGYTVL